MELFLAGGRNMLAGKWRFDLSGSRHVAGWTSTKPCALLSTCCIICRLLLLLVLYCVVLYCVVLHCVDVLCCIVCVVLEPIR
jgi:hypothetical protein